MRLLPLLLLVGCATSTIDLDRQPPPDWPKLAVRYYDASPSEFDSWCSKSTLARHVDSCVVVRFATNECFVLARHGQKLSDEVDKHEREHCAGYDHPGDSTMRNLWERYKARSSASSR